MSSVASTAAGSTYTSTLSQGTSISGGISFAGLGSGTDFQSMIDELQKVEEIPKKRLEMWRADWQRRVDAFDVLLEEIGTLSQNLGAMDSMSTFLTKLVNSTNSTAVTAVAHADAPVGASKINVLQLASNAVLTTTHSNLTKDSVVASGGTDHTFAYHYGDDPLTTEDESILRTLTIPKGTTLQSFVNIINNDTRNPGVTASLIKSGNGYVFQLMGKDTGEEHALTIDPATTLPDFTPGTGTSGNWYERQATDAMFYLDGRAQQILSSSSNSLTEVIPGLTVTLTDTTDDWVWDTSDPANPVLDITTPRPVMLTVTNDAASAKKRIVEFVDGVNALLAKFQELTKVDASRSVVDPTKASSQFASEKGSVLTGNYGVQLLNSKLKSMCVSTGKGYLPLEKDGTGDVFWSLATIGITMDSDESSKTFGQLVIKEGDSEPGSPFKTLDEALAEDPQAVAELLAGDKIVRSNSPDFSYVGMLWKDSVRGGEHNVRWETAADGTVSGVWIDGAAAGYDASTGEWTSTAEGSRGLVLRVDDPGTAGPHSGSFSVKQGKLNELNELCKIELRGANLELGKNGQTSEKGSLHVLRENYLDIIKSIDKKIEQEETRLILWETRMRAQFSRLDTLLANYDRLMQSNAAALGSASSDYGGSD